MKYPYILDLPSTINNCPKYCKNLITTLFPQLVRDGGQARLSNINKKLIEFNAEFIDDENGKTGDVIFKTEHGHMFFVLKYS